MNLPSRLACRLIVTLPAWAMCASWATVQPPVELAAQEVLSEPSGFRSLDSLRPAPNDDSNPQATPTKHSASRNSASGDTATGNKGNSVPSQKEGVQKESFTPGQALAIVGGHPIFVSDMAMEINQLMDKYLGNAPPEIRKSQRPLLIRRLLPKYITAKLMYVDVVSDLPPEADLEQIFETAGKQFDENVVPALQKQAGLKSPAELDAHLRAQGSSLRQMRKSWSENELVKYLTREKVETDPDVSRQELIDYYHAHQDEFKREAKVRWEQIMVRFDEFPSRKAARNAIAKLGNEVVYGASFEAVAKRDSHGIKAEEGGQWEWTKRGSLVSQELEDTLFKLPIDQLSDIVESNVGFHIVRVLERTEAGLVPFTKAQSDIRKKLIEKKKEEAFQEHLQKLRDRIPVDILIEGVNLNGAEG